MLFFYPAAGVGFTGETAWVDGTGGNQPRFNTVSGNVIHHLGLYTKQVSRPLQAYPFLVWQSHTPVGVTCIMLCAWFRFLFGVRIHGVKFIHSLLSVPGFIP